MKKPSRGELVAWVIVGILCILFGLYIAVISGLVKRLEGLVDRVRRRS